MDGHPPLAGAAQAPPTSCRAAQQLPCEQPQTARVQAASARLLPRCGLQVVGSAACFKSYDLHTVTLEELKAPLKVGLRGGERAC